MTLQKTLIAAEEFGIAPRQAIMARLKVLMPQITELERELFRHKKREASAATQRARDGIAVFFILCENELKPLQAEAKSLLEYLNGKNRKFEKAGAADKLPEHMIERAKTYPLPALLGQEPKGSMVCCPFHDDRSPSASIKNNYLICFGGCKPKDPKKKGWNSITLLMERDGVDFRSAVLRLQ